MHAVQITEYGDAGVLRMQELPDPQPSANDVVVRVEAAGLNFIDVYQRSGFYQIPLPFIPGQEGAGTVVAVGTSVGDVRVGERVAWQGIMGSYASLAVIPADRVVPIPDSVDTGTAAAVLLQGMTAHYLTHSTYDLRVGDVCVVHAAAGGVGLLLCQMATACGARVIGTVSTAEKEALARQAGADEVINYRTHDFVTEVRRLTDGHGVQVVYDSVGKDTIRGSLQCLAPRGMLVSFGQSSGASPAIDPLELSRGGSLYLTRPVLQHYVATRSELEWRARDLFEWIAEGSLHVRIDRTYPLADAAEAHRALEGRATSGKVLLIP